MEGVEERKVIILILFKTTEERVRERHQCLKYGSIPNK